MILSPKNGSLDPAKHKDPAPMKRSDQLALGLVGLFAIGVAVASAQTITNPPLPNTIGAAYNASPPTLSDGTAGWLQLDSVGSLRVTGTVSSGADAASTVISTAALASSLVVKASAGNLYSFEVAADSTLSAAAWWIMIFNATSLPSDGAVTPAKCYAMPLGTTSYAGAFPFPARFGTGITIGVSTNGCFTLAASVHAFISGDFK